MANLNLDLTNDTTQDDFSPVPAGEYTMQIVDSKVSTSKSGQYVMANFELSIVSDAYRGRKIFDQIIVDGSSGANQDAIRIGRQKLKTLATVAGHKNPNYIRDTEEFHGLTVDAKVDIDGDYNRIKSYRKSSGSNGNMVPPEVASQKMQQASSSSPKYPWGK